MLRTLSLTSSLTILQLIDVVDEDEVSESRGDGMNCQIHPRQQDLPERVI